MINFKQYIQESRSAPLYHSTSILFLSRIEKQGLKPVTIHSSSKVGGLKNYNFLSSYDGQNTDGVQGVSLTRSLDFAKRWNNEHSLILQLDQRRLNQNFKIIPFQYFQKGGYARVNPQENEFEEFVVTNKNIPFKYVTAILINKNIHVNKNEIEAIRQKYGSSFIKLYN